METPSSKSEPGSQRADRQGDEQSAFFRRLRDHPSATMHNIRKLSADKVYSSSNPELCKELEFLQQALDEPTKLGKQTWNTLMRDDELPEMYMGFIQRDAFFKENPIFIAAVFEGLANVAKGSFEMNDATTGVVFLKHSAPLFRVVWKNRELLRRVAPGPYSLYNEVHPVMRCVGIISEMYRRSLLSFAGFDTYIPHVAFFGWVCLGDTLHSLSAFVCVVDRTKCSESMLEKFLQETLVNVGGAKAVLMRFEQALDDESGQPRPLDVMTVMQGLLKHSSLRFPFLQREATYRHIVSLLNRRAHSGEMNSEEHQTACMEWVAAMTFFTIPVKAWGEALENENKDSVGFAVRGEDTIACLARGIGWMARTAFHSHLDQTLLGSAKVEELTDSLELYGLWFDGGYWKKFAPAFADGLDRGLREEWIPTLDALRASKSRLDSSNPGYNRVYLQRGKSLKL